MCILLKFLNALQQQFEVPGYCGFQHHKLSCSLHSFLFSAVMATDACVTAEHLKGPTLVQKLLTASFSTARTVGFILDRGFLQARLLSLP